MIKKILISICLIWILSGCAPIQFFSRYISPIDGSRCPMYPSCSAYAKKAVEKHGHVMGWIMACDRLMRCGRDELDHSPGIWIKGEIYCDDPVSKNDFWW